MLPSGFRFHPKFQIQISEVLTTGEGEAPEKEGTPPVRPSLHGELPLRRALQRPWGEEAGDLPGGHWWRNGILGGRGAALQPRQGDHSFARAIQGQS